MNVNIRGTVTCVGTLAAVVSMCGSHAEEPAADRFLQDRFAIGFWVDPPADERMAERYAEIADANFTLIIGGFGATTRAHVERQLALCEQHDLRAVVITNNAVPEEYGSLPDSPACWGYLLQDEPSAGEFAPLREKADAIRETQPGKFAFVNLLPQYVTPERLEAKDYDDYVRRYCEEVQPAVLCMDHYPLFTPGADGRDAYCENLAYMHKYSLQFGIPFWNFFNIMPYGPHTDPSEAQVRWQVYTSLAYGAKGVLYFCYYTPVSHEFPKGGAIIARDGTKTRHWYQARRINEQLKNMGPTLMRLTSTGVYRVKTGDKAAAVLSGTPIRDLSRADHDPEHDYLVGVFTHEDGRRAVLLNNYRFDYTAWPTVAFDADPAEVAEIDKWSGQEVPVRDDSPEMEGVQLSLDAGEGRLFLLGAPDEASGTK